MLVARPSNIQIVFNYRQAREVNNRRQILTGNLKLFSFWAGQRLSPRLRSLENNQNLFKYMVRTHSLVD